MKQNEAKKLMWVIKALSEIYLQEVLKEQRVRKRRSNLVLIKTEKEEK